MAGIRGTSTAMWIGRLVLVALWPTIAAAQDADLSMTVDRQELGIAERLRLSLQVTAPSTALVAFPDVGAELEDFTIVSQSQIPPASTDDEVQTWRQDYVLAPRQVGETAIPPLTAIVQQAPDRTGMRQHELQTDALPIKVISLVPADATITALRDVSPPVALTPATLFPLVWPVAGVAALLVGLGLLIWRRWRTPGKTPRSAHELALAALQDLDPNDQAQVDRFYMRLSGVLRRYVFWRFGLQAPRRTTDEMLAAMAQAGDALSQRSERIGGLLRDFDRVKFARYQPQVDDMRRALADVADVIEATADATIIVPPSAQPDMP